MSETRWSLVFTSEDDLDVTADRVAQSLEVSFSAHESLYRGGDYRRAGQAHGPLGVVIVQRNRELDDERREDCAAPTLVYLDPLGDKADRVVSALVASGLRLFRREAWSADQE